VTPPYRRRSMHTRLAANWWLAINCWLTTNCWLVANGILRHIPFLLYILYLNFAELSEIKSILYFAEFQKGTSENALFGNFFHYPPSVL
jgi:hypothetical protein